MNTPPVPLVLTWGFPKIIRSFVYQGRLCSFPGKSEFLIAPLEFLPLLHLSLINPSRQRDPLLSAEGQAWCLRHAGQMLYSGALLSAPQRNLGLFFTAPSTPESPPHYLDPLLWWPPLSCLLQQGIGLATSSLARGTKNATVLLHTPQNGRGSSRRDLSHFQKLQRSLSVQFLLRNFLEVGPCSDSALVLGVNKPG